MPLLRIALLFILLALPAVADSASDLKEHMRNGQTHYAIGEFQEAIREFRLAYKLRQDPGLLFNIAQCERQLHEYQQAYFHYRQYLNQRPEAANRKEVESLIEQMRRKADEEEEQRTRKERDPAAAANPEDTLAAAESPGTNAPAKTAAPAAALAGRPAPAAPSTSRLRIAGYAALAAGAGTEGLAFLFHSSAQSAADQFNGKYAAGTLTGADARLKSDAESKGRLATAALIGGAALLAAGAVLCFAF